MSEAHRSSLYALLREHIDEPLAEYVMSCLAPAPLTDLVTKDHLDTVLAAEFSKHTAELTAKFVTKDHLDTVLAAEFSKHTAELTAKFVTKDHLDTVLAAEFSAFSLTMAAQREADRNEAAAQREADRETAGKRHKLLVGAAILLGAEIVAAEAGWLRWFTDLLATIV